MKYTIDAVRNILYNLKEDSMRTIFTEHFLEQIEKRNIPDTGLEGLLEEGRLVEIKKIEGSSNRFELRFSLDGPSELFVLISMLNTDKVILISAFVTNSCSGDSPELLEFEGVYDMALDLADFHSTYGFRHSRTVEIDEWVNVDFDSCDHPVAVEMIRPSKRFRLTPKAFSSAKFDGWIEIRADVIRIQLRASLEERTLGTRVFEGEVANVHHLKSGKFDFDVIAIKLD